MMLIGSRLVVLVLVCLGSACAAAPPPPAEPPSPAAGAVEPAAAASSAPPAPSTDPSVEPATAAAQAWLALIDQQKYEDSWKTSAKMFQGAVSSADWAKAAAGARGPLGKVTSRQVQSAEPRTSVPGGPDGHYVILQFKTVFEKKADAVETVTPMLEVDGSWKVSGYFIR